jgi:hypothetical protein
MALLPTPLAATAFAPHGRLKTLGVAGGRPGGVAGVTVDPLAQVRKFGGQSGELLAELFVLLLLPLKLTENLKEASPHTHRGGGPVFF